MSIRIMTDVWEHSKAKGSTLLLLLAIADNANDEGIAWPGTEYLAHKIRMSERQVTRLRQNLYDSGELEYVSGGKFKGDNLSVMVRVTSCPKGDKLSAKGDTQGMPRVTSGVNKGDKGVSLTIIEPSLEPSIEPSLPAIDDDIPFEPWSPEPEPGQAGQAKTPTVFELLTDSFVGMYDSVAKRYKNMDPELVARIVFKWKADNVSIKVLPSRLLGDRNPPELQNTDRRHPYYIRYFGQYDFDAAEAADRSEYAAGLDVDDATSRSEYATWNEASSAEDRSEYATWRETA